MNNRGRHKTEVYLVRTTRTHDGAGGYVKSLDEAGKTFWFASIRAASARDFKAAAQENQIITHVINIDQDPPGGIQKDDVVRRISDGVEFGVLSVREASEGSIALHAEQHQRGH